MDFIFLGSLVVAVELLQQRLVRGFWEADFFVEQGENAKRSAFNEIKAVLVVFEGDG